ncbi:MFS transporter [Leucobacter coleopterorum]|uniref:MFS transporter n=1 Tax=Leucobacter coleopterorum TaxID=2714933 RepID=A0ABX6JUK6_9MICO|nr:MFS transporter [Leucobacter coleopterorum]QIM17997.1 MFS transporter [Leucobacter coleopterorum]
MSMSDPAAEPVESADFDGEEVAQEPIVVESEIEVTLQRSVRVGRVIIGAAIVGGVVAALAALFFPIDEKADYTMGQVMGFSALIGIAAGLGIGALLVLILNAAAKRRRGTGVAIQSDVR